MQILIIEDDVDKRKDIISQITDIYELKISIVEKESLRSGLKEIIENDKYDLLILDMSMPNFDINKNEPTGGTPESFAGKEIMEQMKLREIFIPTIVITQYNSFEQGSISLDYLKEILQVNFNDFFIDIIHYNSAFDDWRNNLIDILRGMKEKNL